MLNIEDNVTGGETFEKADEEVRRKGSRMWSECRHDSERIEMLRTELLSTIGAMHSIMEKHAWLTLIAAEALCGPIADWSGRGGNDADDAA